MIVQLTHTRMVVLALVVPIIIHVPVLRDTTGHVPNKLHPLGIGGEWRAYVCTNGHE